MVLSSISYKIFIYNLLYLPALGLMVGLMIGKDTFKKAGKELSIECKITGILFLLLGFMIIFVWILIKSNYLVPLGLYLTGAGAIACIIIAVFLSFASGFLLLYPWGRQYSGTNVVVAIIFMFLFPKALVSFTVPELDRILSPKRLCERIKWYKEEGFETGQYKIELGILNYYAQTDLKRLYTFEEMKEFLEKNPRAVVAITSNHLEMNRNRLDTVNVYENAHIGGTSPERTYHLLVQDGTHLKPLVEAMKKYREQGFALARYKNDITLFDYYLGEKLTEIGLKRDIKPFVEKNPKAAMVSSEYWITKNAPQLKDWVVKEKAFFAGRFYCLLVYGENE